MTSEQNVFHNENFDNLNYKEDRHDRSKEAKLFADLFRLWPESIVEPQENLEQE
jgi:hypothetical protein